MLKRLLLTIMVLLSTYSADARRYDDPPGWYYRDYGTFERHNRFYPHRNCSKCRTSSICNDGPVMRWCVLKCSMKVDIPRFCGERRYHGVIKDLERNRYRLNDEDRSLLDMVLGY